MKSLAIRVSLLKVQSSLAICLLLCFPMLCAGQSQSSGRSTGTNVSSNVYRAAEHYFREFDKDGDGLLSFDELQKSNIRDEKAKFDTNRDGVIEVKEYAGFLDGYLAKQAAERRSKAANRSDPSRSQDQNAERAKHFFGRFDKNGDGRLNDDEIQGSKIRYEKEKFDTDKNGVISLAEYTGFYEVHTAREQAKSAKAKKEGRPVPDPFSELDEKPKVYYAESLPDNLPAWFKELDTNKDGQVALYEWRDGSRTTEGFKPYDHNHDAFATAQEVLDTLELSKQDAKKQSSSRSSQRRYR